MVDIESYIEMKEVDGNEEDERFRNNDEDGKIVLSSVCDIKYAIENKKDEKILASRAWKPMRLEGEYCHDLLELSGSSHVEFKTHSKKKVELGCLRIQKVKLRKHLVSIGWSIESKRDTMIRFRYISPEQKIYYSLIKVFQYLLKEKAKMNSAVRDKGKSKDIDLDNNLLVIPPLKAEFVSLNHDQIIHSGDVELFATQQIAELFFGESTSSGLMNCKVMQLNSPKFIGENAQVSCNCLAMINETVDLRENNKYEDTKALHSSEGVINTYIDHIKMPKAKPKLSSADAKDLRSKTRDYLLEKGWKFWLYDKKVRMELRYTSPKGRTYISLYTACKGYLEEHLGRKNELKRTMQKEKLVQEPFFSSNLSSPGEFDFKEHLGKKRKLKRRKLKYPNLDKALDERLQNNYCDHKHAVKIDDFGASSSQKPFSRSFTSHVLHSGKRSRWTMVLSSKDQVVKKILSWLIQKDVVLPRQKVAFVRKIDSHILKEGWITHDGIKCRCCLNVFSLSQFGVHAGSRTFKPSASIILEDGRSLLDCQKQILSAFKPNKFQHARLRSNYFNHEADDICTICQDGGLIMLCDLCPSAFHPTCISLEDVPEGQWFCPSCQCGICNLSEFNCDTENFTQNSGIYCDQCERQYHVRCLQKQGLLLEEYPIGTWTCSKACSKIISHLQLLLGKSNPTDVEGLHWTILRSNMEDIGKLDDESVVDNLGKLHIALDVLHECFETMVEARTQSDLVADIIFNNNSELNRLNFRGFYTILLMCGDELITVATFRIFGERVAEMPFIGTRVKFRRQGMCRILVNELQQLLSSLGVERLLLPAVPELQKTWISSFGFTEITPSDRLELLPHTILTFQGTTLCQKFLKKPSVSAI